MNTVTIILLLSMCLCALCGATPAVSSLDQELVPSNRINEIATTLHRTARQSDPLSFIEGVASNLINIPSTLMEDIVRFIMSVISKIRSTFISLLRRIENVAKSLIPSPNSESSENSPQRRRRSNVSNGLSDLISDLPNLLKLPLNYLQEATSSFGSSVGGQIVNVVEIIARLIWDFLTTRLIPWLHDMLQKLQKSDILPSYMNDAIGSVDSIYPLLRLLSVIKPSNA